MDRLVLTQTVRLVGRDFWGKESCLLLEPAGAVTNDWVWFDGKRDVPITVDTLASKPRRIALVSERHTLNEFEHIGILRAAGLRGVRVSLLGGRTWPPFDGSSFALWQAVMPYLRKSGELRPYNLMANHVSALPKQNAERYVQYWADNKTDKVLHITGEVRFPRIRDQSYTFWHPHNSAADLLPLMRSKTLGWPPYLHLASRVASALGWPHHRNILWVQACDSAQQALEQIGLHRMLDMLGVLNFIAPADSYLCGALHSHRGNHATDLGLLKKLAKKKVLPFERAA